MDDREAQARAEDTSPARLQELAMDPQLQKVVAENPATYPQLLEWISEWGTPEAQAVAKSRIAGQRLGAKVEEGSGDSPDDVTTIAQNSLSPSDADDKTKLAASSNKSGKAADATILTAASGPLPKATPPPVPATPVTAPGPAHQPAARPHGAPASQGPPSPAPQGSTAPRAPMVPPSAQRDARQAAQPGSPGFQSSQTESPAEDQGMPIWVWAAIGAGVAIILGFLLWFFLLAPEDGADDVVSDDAAATEEDLDAETDSTKDEDGEGDGADESEAAEDQEPEIDYSLEPVAPTINFPAPPDHVEASWFVSADKKIACEMGSTSTACTIHDYNFTVDEGGCGSGPATLVLDLDGVRWDCSHPEVSRTDNDQAPILTASTSSATGMDACLSTIGGMSCWNTLNGNSFALSPYGWTEGDDGLIPENQFPWIGQVDRR